jgi:hypothetical protein
VSRVSTSPRRMRRNGYAIGGLMKGQQKPKKLAKKAPQKTLKEQRAAKAAKKKSRG